MADHKGEKVVANSTAPPPTLAVAKELFAGTVGGTAQICVGHPFDTVKVKLQSMKKPLPGQPPMYTGAVDVVRQVVAREGVRGLFAGIQAPLPFVAVFNATLFAANGTMRRVLGKGRPEEQLSLAEIGAAGVGAGAAVSFVACPTELVKCRLQAQPGVFNGAIDCTRQVVANRGMSGLFTGMQATMIREMPGNALYFMAYVGTQRSMIPEGGSVKDLNSGQLLIAGGMAGLAFWLPCYPMDLCKTLIQTDSETNPKYRGFFDCVRKVVKSEGVRGLYKGIGPCLARAFPANAVTLLAYEYTKGLLG
ncbi:Mitochondrial carnitine/acylcarnitine carrier-like protein [Gracilariopsis chorda]|uniref:Mitochondrial carnitine/acylcarnitine carrier-like protein n=1 Tax=Gracilariopsis chorda TaxID=448386 RepID=A0A2V3J0K1_9FLOR|nr:Mitochondrial carnitine/acylcarnitine carrier-like protein [Gracilariopsis chorda]|eukprot:PXF47908.1 Mitochondrial carnitine/acylcarnitine carrier-like protein [Gracilariopsis chorda]